MTILKGYGAPTVSTPGNKGDLYIDINTDRLRSKIRKSLMHKYTM